MSRLRILVFNLENLFLYLDRYEGDGRDFSNMGKFAWQRLSSSNVRNKSLQQTQWIARVIQHIDPDVAMLSEVGGPESLRNLNRFFLGHQYDPHIVEGNSGRGIDIGYLTKRSLRQYGGWRFHFKSHKDRDLGFLYPHEEQSLRAGYIEIGSRPIQPHRFSRDVAELDVTTNDGIRLIFFSCILNQN